MPVSWSLSSPPSFLFSALPIALALSVVLCRLGASASERKPPDQPIMRNLSCQSWSRASMPPSIISLQVIPALITTTKLTSCMVLNSKSHVGTHCEAWGLSTKLLSGIKWHTKFSTMTAAEVLIVRASCATSAKKRPIRQLRAMSRVMATFFSCPGPVACMWSPAVPWCAMEPLFTASTVKYWSTSRLKFSMCVRSVLSTSKGYTVFSAKSAEAWIPNGMIRVRSRIAVVEKE
mmetsp:Transcript_49102/g.83899  ORF Transcript_49102/g.83899 Transcript_49102/m.83899 type:complete len:233 (+) Transcript_49102:454-1152(+)